MVVRNNQNTFHQTKVKATTQEGCNKQSKKISLDKKNSWVQDQYNHPLESLHSMGEVLDWFKKKKISFISSIPKIIGEFGNDEKLFKQQNRGDVIDRFNIQFEMILNYQYKEGGLFMMIGKRNKTKV